MTFYYSFATITPLPQWSTSMGVYMILYYSFTTMKYKYGCLYDSLLLFCHNEVQVWYVFIWFFITPLPQWSTSMVHVYIIPYYSFATMKYKYGCWYDFFHYSFATKKYKYGCLYDSLLLLCHNEVQVMGVYIILYYSFATVKCKYGTCLYDSLLLLCHNEVQVWYVFILILHYSFATMKYKYGTCLYDSLLLLCHSEVQVWYVFIWFFITHLPQLSTSMGVYMILYYSFATMKYKYRC